MPSGKRIKILNPDDIELLYSIPQLGDEDRKFLFDLTEIDSQFLNTLFKYEEKIDYIGFH